jgi:hypothetical protein
MIKIKLNEASNYIKFFLLVSPFIYLKCHKVLNFLFTGEEVAQRMTSHCNLYGRGVGSKQVDMITACMYWIMEFA